MSGKTRILYWTPFFLPDIGGIETLSSKLLPALGEEGYDITVLTSHGKYDLPDRTEFNGIPVFRFHMRSVVGKRDLSGIMEIRERVAALKKSFKPHLIHIHMSDPSVYFHLSTSAVSFAPTIVSMHQGMEYFGFKGGKDTLIGKALHAADWVTAVSRATLSDLRRMAPEIKNCSSVIYNGVTSPDIVPDPILFYPPRILFLGRLIHAKGVDLAISAFASLLGGFPEAQLVIAGGGPKRIELERQVAKLRLADSVTFTGAVRPEKVHALINQATLVVMPSRVEGFPMAALEAAQMSRPVVASMVGGLAEAVLHEETGLLVEPENIPAIADAILFLLDHPEVASAMGRAARMRVLKEFSLDSCVDAYSRLYHRLVRPASEPVSMGQQ